MRSLFRRIKRNGVAMSTLRILGTALVLALGSQPTQSARAAESAVCDPTRAEGAGRYTREGDVDDHRRLSAWGGRPVHRHDAHAFIYVLQGSIVMQVRGGKEVTLVPGQTFYEGPNDVHTVGRNAITTEPAKFIVILLKKKGFDVVLPAESFACPPPVATKMTGINIRYDGALLGARVWSRRDTAADQTVGCSGGKLKADARA